MRRTSVRVTADPATNTPKDFTMQTIVSATQKGGSGRSTLAIGLALAAIQAGHQVRLVETNSQGTLRTGGAAASIPSPWSSRFTAAANSSNGCSPLPERRNLGDRRYRRRRQRRNKGGHSLGRLVPDPARPTIADIEATAATLHVVRACDTHSPSSSTRRRSAVSASTTLRHRFATKGRSNTDVLAQPFIVMRNHHQDA